MSAVIANMIREAAGRLAEGGVENPRLDAELLLSDLLGLDRVGLYSQGEIVPAEEIQNEYAARIARRLRGEPVARIVGYREFLKHRFVVSDHVLIPRPETEALVEFYLAQNRPADRRILDLCCGSGCIGLSILRERPELELHLTDISGEALETAHENACRICGDLMNRITFRESDFLDYLPGEYDAIFCNPPYIHPDERDRLEVEVRKYDPPLALFHENPEAMYANLIIAAKERLSAGGLFYLETAPRWAAGAAESARANGYREFRIEHDLAGLERYLLLKN